MESCAALGLESSALAAAIHGVGKGRTPFRPSRHFRQKCPITTVAAVILTTSRPLSRTAPPLILLPNLPNLSGISPLFLTQLIF